MAEYFYIATEDTDNVLECRGSANLTVSKYDGGEEQHWKWTENGCLENRYSHKVISRFKNGLLRKSTLRVDNDRKKPYQKWLLIDLKLRNQSGEYMYMKDDTKVVYLTKNTDSCQLKWLFIPIAKVSGYQFYLQNPNPLMKAKLLQQIILEHMSCIVGCDFRAFCSLLAEFDAITKQYATKLTKVTRDVGISKVTGGSVSIIGSTLALVGFGLAPYTAGASIGLTIAGTVISTAGGFTSFGGLITSILYRWHERNKARNVMEKAIRYTTTLHSFMSELSKQIEESPKFCESSDGIKYKTWLSAIISTALNGGGACRTIDTSVDVAKGLVELKMIANIAKVDAQATRSATAVAESIAASGIKIPVKGRALLQASTTGAKVFSCTISAFIIFFGLYDIYDGVFGIMGKSKHLRNLRRMITECSALGEHLIRAYNELANDE